MSGRSKILDRIAAECGLPDLVAVLSENISGADLKSLLMEVSARRASRQTVSDVLDQFGSDPLTQPSLTDPFRMLEVDLLAFTLAKEHFEPIELAPICPLGTITSLTSLNQDRIVSTTRKSEVVSDSTNVLALECARRRRKGYQEPIRLCASHRLMRPGVELKPGDLPHFRMFGLCSSVRGAKGFELEIGELRRHLNFHMALLRALKFKDGLGGRIRLTLSAFGAMSHEVLTELTSALGKDFSGVDVSPDHERVHGKGYYSGLCFHVYFEIAGKEYFVADGGFVDWTKELLHDRRERMLISGIGTERLCGIA